MKEFSAYTPCSLRNPCAEPLGPLKAPVPGLGETQYLPPAPRDPCPRLQRALTPRFPKPKRLLLPMLEVILPTPHRPQEPSLPVLRPHTGVWGGSVRGSGVRWVPRRRQRLSWQCKNCTEALKTGRRRKLKRAASGRGGGKVTEESAGQPPRSSARVGPGAGREEGVTQQRCRARLQRGEGRARAAWGWSVAFRIQLRPPARRPGLPHV